MLKLRLLLIALKKYMLRSGKLGVAASELFGA